MKFKKVGLDEAESKPFEIVSRFPDCNGRTTVTIRCPYCGRLTRAYVWSLAGHGKRCENPSCRVIFQYMTMSAFKDRIPEK